MQVNPNTLGYKCISLLAIITAKENESKAKEYLKSKPYVAAILGPFAAYNFSSLVVLSSIQELSLIQEKVEASPLIRHVDTLIWAEVVNIDHAENLVIKPFTDKNEQKPTTINLEETRIDETDRQIAKTLSQNSRTPFRKIAEKLNISTKTVIQRYKKLRGNVLTLSTITVDLNKLGYKAAAHVFIKLANKSKAPEIQAQLLQIPNLIVTVRFIGPYDLFAIVVLADFEELFKITDSIQRIQGVEKAEPFLNPADPAWPLNLFASLL